VSDAEKAVTLLSGASPRFVRAHSTPMHPREELAYAQMYARRLANLANDRTGDVGEAAADALREDS
jgi:hypothetical protein